MSSSRDHSTGYHRQSSGRQRERRKERERKQKPPPKPEESGSIFFVLLLLGLIFCLADVAYILHYIDSDSLQQQEKHQVMPSAVQKAGHHSIQLIHPQRPLDSIQFQQLAKGKETILAILETAGIDTRNQLDEATMLQLPTWQQVTDLIGTSPKIYGLDTCETFQTTVNPPDAFVAPAGAFNSGTNLMAELLIANCRLPQRQAKYGAANHGVRWQVNWGKHQSPRFRSSNHSVHDDGKVVNENILPIVTIRDPYSWLQSLCRHRYSTHWFHAPGHCPNLVPNKVDYEFLKYGEDKSYKQDFKFVYLHHRDPWLVDNVMNTANFTAQDKVVPVYVRYKMETRNHDSLVHFYNEWYDEYMHADFPRVVVRFEDLIFFGKQVTTAACKCAGGVMYDVFRHVEASAKKGKVHGDDKTSLVDAMIRYSQKQSVNTKGMTKEDLEYARQHLSQEYMTIFDYRHPRVKK